MTTTFQDIKNHTILNSTKTLYLKNKIINSKIVIATPHHAKGGVKTLPNIEHPNSDENVGFIAYELSKKLNTSLIVGCNATEDLNKNWNTQYSKTILKWSPNLLIEIHGHSATSTPDNIIEISGGHFNKTIAFNFSKILQEFINKSNLNYTVNGNYHNLNFKATKSVTINTEKWISLHIELPPSLRINKNNKVPEICNEFINNLVKVIQIFEFSKTPHI